MYSLFDWSSNCGDSFRRELADNAQAQIYFAPKSPVISPNVNMP